MRVPNSTFHVWKTTIDTLRSNGSYGASAALLAFARDANTAVRYFRNIAHVYRQLICRSAPTAPSEFYTTNKKASELTNEASRHRAYPTPLFAHCALHPLLHYSGAVEVTRA